MNSSSRPKWQSLLAVAAILVAAGGAEAAALPFTASLEIQIPGIDQTLQGPVVFGAGTAIANGSAGGSHIASLALAGSTFATTGVVVPFTDPAVAPINGIQLTVHNGAGNFADGGGTLGGVMPLAGFAKVCLFGPCSAPAANILIPLEVVGNGGTVFYGAFMNVTVIGAPWTTGTAAVGALTSMGSAHGPASATSSTFVPGGQLKLVTPIYVSTGMPASNPLPAFGILTLHFVPEPATLALLASGMGLLAVMGRARSRD